MRGTCVSKKIVLTQCVLAEKNDGVLGHAEEVLMLHWSSSIADGRGRWIDDARSTTVFIACVRSFSVGTPHAGAGESEWSRFQIDPVRGSRPPQ